MRRGERSALSSGGRGSWCRAPERARGAWRSSGADARRELAAAPGWMRTQGEEPIEAAWRELKEETGLGESDVDRPCRVPGVGRLRVAGGRASRCTAATASGAVRSSSGSCSTHYDADDRADARRQRVRRLAMGRAGVADRPRGRVATARLPAGAWERCERLSSRSGRRSNTCAATHRWPRPSAAAHARRCRRSGPPRRPRQAALRRLVEQDRLTECDLLGPARHGQDHAGAGRCRQHQAGLRTDERGQRRRQGRARRDRAGPAAHRRARARHDPVPRRDPPLQQGAAGRVCCRRSRTAR